MKTLQVDGAVVQVTISLPHDYIDYILKNGKWKREGSLRSVSRGSQLERRLNIELAKHTGGMLKAAKLHVKDNADKI